MCAVTGCSRRDLYVSLTVFCCLKSQYYWLSLPSLLLLFPAFCSFKALPSAALWWATSTCKLHLNLFRSFAGLVFFCLMGGGIDSSRAQTNVRACICRTAGARGQEPARGGGKRGKIRVPSFGKRELLREPWPSVWSTKFIWCINWSMSKDLNWSRVGASTEMSPEQRLSLSTLVLHHHWEKEKRGLKSTLYFKKIKKSPRGEKGRKVLVSDSTVLHNRLSSSFALRCLNSDRVHNGYSNGHMNTHMLVLLKSTK